MKNFDLLPNIENSFKKLKLFVLVFFSLCTITSVFSIYEAYDFALEQRKKIYVLDRGKSLLLALQDDMVSNRELEAKDHVARFHELFFTLSPSQSAIEYNINRALNLANRSAYEYYKDLTEAGYFTRIISASISQNIEIDSVQLNFQSYPYQVNVYAKQYILRESSLTEKNLITRCQLVDIARSEENPHGFMIEQFEVLDNSQIRQITRNR